MLERSQENGITFVMKFIVSINHFIVTRRSLEQFVFARMKETVVCLIMIYMVI